MALTGFVNGAFASVVINPFGGLPDQLGPSRARLVLKSGYWAMAFVSAPLGHPVHPKHAARLQRQMRDRRETMVGKL
jgi:hypothetical protein